MMPVNDTINIKNGMNYAMFLEAILRICYYRAETEGIQYKKVLDQVFNDAANDIDISKRSLDDPILALVYSPEICEEFEASTDLLQAIFDKKSLTRDNTYMEMSHDDFVNLMTEASIVVVPKKKEEKKEDNKKKPLAV
jgi:hypothetical protein